MYECLGVSPSAELIDREGRPQRICDGKPITALF
jgi:hypothetical protein